MFTQIRERTAAGQLADLDAPGPTVRLLEQTQDHRAVFQDGGGDLAELAASEFFALYREATPEEIEAFPAAPPASRKAHHKESA